MPSPPYPRALSLAAQPARSVPLVLFGRLPVVICDLLLGELYKMIERYGHGPDVCTRFQLSLGPPVEYEISRGGHGYEIKNVNMRACTRVGTLFTLYRDGDTAIGMGHGGYLREI